MTLGGRLRERREATGLSLMDVSEAIKIAPRHLSALERDALKELPTGIYGWFFLRTYAKHLGLDVAEMKALFEEATGGSPRAPEGSGATRPASPPKSEVRSQKLEVEKPLPPKSEVRSQKVEFHRTRAASPSLKRDWGWPTGPRAVWWMSGSIAMMVVAFLIYRMPIKDHGGFRTSTSPPTSSVVLSLQTPTPAPIPPVAKVAEAILHVKAKSPTWFEVTVDGQDRFSLNMKPGEERSWLARQSFRVWVGSPLAMDFSLNGKPIQLESPQGGPLRDVEIFPDARIQYHTSPFDAP